MIKRFPLKTNTFKSIFSFAFFVFLIACSTKKDTFMARNSHALSTKYNILYNGQIGLDKGVEAINATSKDNYWKRLPIERMQLVENVSAEGKPKNKDFEVAETKATKAIQKHSMNIGGREKNTQIDEAYLLLGKSRYYDQRFIPALDAFNYILYKYPNSSNIYTAKIWREKTNMRLGNDALVVKNIEKLLKDKALKKQPLADANALLSEAFLNLEEKDSAITKLKVAENTTKIHEEKARYRFILGQLYQELGKKDSALYYYNEVIAMNRKSKREYIIQSQARKIKLFDYQKDDAAALITTYNKLLADRENRPFLDVINYNMGLFYDNKKEDSLATKYYNASLKTVSKDPYLIASNYRNLGDINFKKTQYQTAAKYYDSTLVKLDPKTREAIHIQKKRKDLEEVIHFETIAKTNDSILHVVAMSDGDRVAYFEKYIEQLKKADEAKRILEEKQLKIAENIERNAAANATDPSTADDIPGARTRKSLLAPPSIATGNDNGSVFYFYNPNTVAFGKVEFKKKFGDRALADNWLLSTKKTNSIVDDTNDNTSADSLAKVPVINPKYMADYYTKQVPTNPVKIDSLSKERNLAYYQLGVIYKERFKEYGLASNKLEQLLKNNPEEKLVLPAKYNLYKIYQITNATKAEEMKNSISKDYPNSRYAQIINNVGSTEELEKGSPESLYKSCYRMFESEQFAAVIKRCDVMIKQFSGDEIVSKFEFLKANATGKLKGLVAYKGAIQYVADNYPNTEEGKKAQEVLTTQIPFLEQMTFTTTDSKSWKMMFKVPVLDDKKTASIEQKIMKFMDNENIQKLSYSCDAYTDNEKIITINGFKSEANSMDVANQFAENPKYKIDQKGIVISNENYKVIQIKKNLEEYITLKTK
ncbi:type IX secretion system periplasmic lipoprotein PorW/SprE [Flavobacterium restrictum]|uniref:type IX secretion system periplasmic lipoprotein PorW/SprE n=1 Tax=Flavobacterium restrictum TaxID=2594428 RepID=UPI001F42E522|nr:gliding motility protein [Flavobacterium restrictum]